MVKNNPQRTRGKFLTVTLVIVTLLSVLTIPDLFKGPSLIGLEMPLWVSKFYVLFGILNLIGVAGIWFWKKWAVFLLIGTFMFEALLNSIFVKVTTVQIGYVIGGLIIISFEILFIWAIFRKWRLFN